FTFPPNDNRSDSAEPRRSLTFSVSSTERFLSAKKLLSRNEQFIPRKEAKQKMFLRCHFDNKTQTKRRERQCSPKHSSENRCRHWTTPSITALAQPIGVSVFVPTSWGNSIVHVFLNFRKKKRQNFLRQWQHLASG